MKNTTNNIARIIFTTGLAISMVLGAWNAAAAAPKVSHWRGQGTVFNAKTDKVGKYTLKMRRTELAKGKAKIEVTVGFPGGRTAKRTCLTTDRGRGWVSDCGTRQAKGRCFGNGMCLDYAQDKSGNAFATTIAFDGKNTMRLMRTELKQGKAVRFFNERLDRVNR